MEKLPGYIKSEFDTLDDCIKSLKRFSSIKRFEKTPMADWRDSRLNKVIYYANDIIPWNWHFLIRDIFDHEGTLHISIELNLLLSTEDYRWIEGRFDFIWGQVGEFNVVFNYVFCNQDVFNIDQ